MRHAPPSHRASAIGHQPAGVDGFWLRVPVSSLKFQVQSFVLRFSFFVLPSSFFLLP
jgi:hypothetical protein